MGSSYLTSLSVLCALLFFVLGSLSHARDTIREGQPLRDGETLISSGGVFEMGFFRPGNSSRRYVGIWYYQFSTNTVLWVANRENPINDTSGSMAIGSSGNLEVLDGRNSVLWTSNVTVSSNSSSATLFNNGNLQLNDSGSVVWQSFDHPTDTYLPGMKVGLDMKTGINQFFTSWKSEDDPAVGNFSMGIDPLRSTQIFIWEGTKPRWRSGRWNGQTFIGIPDMVPTYIYGFKLSNFDQEGKMYFYYSQFNSSHRYVLSWYGIEQHMIWRNDTSVWGRSWAQPITDCELYNKCGNNGICTDSNTPICACLDGFEPVVNEEWNSGNWTRGCARRTPLACVSNDSSTDGFLKIEGVKLPDFSDWVVDVPSTDSCKEKCLRNCSCKAYTYPSGIGCLIWGVDLLDIHQFSSGGSEMYLRLAASEIACGNWEAVAAVQLHLSDWTTEDKSKAIVTYVIVPIVLGVLILLIGSVYLIWKYKNRIKVWFRQQKAEEVSLFSQGRSWEKSADFSGAIELGEEEGDRKCPELPLFTFDSIVAATNNFYFSNLLGEGGFGPVYKGKLPGGREIAVKRLSKSSRQGMGEFKNEVILIAKLQHRNLVRLLGCCIKEEEKILVYEYMPNRSLDIFLLDSKKKELLDWKKRYNIIEGIARGLLYLHRDSRLRIIHRDLKASNILLDEEMNPKISDFGLARITGSDENQANTKRVVGTYGYMSPEYAMQGLFSVKSDVYSFGVLLLEIVSGKRNSVFHDPESKINLLANAWQLWNENRAMEFVDTSISYSCTQREVLRCINAGLMCVQDRPIDRPTMSSVIILLESETIAQPSPRPPTFTAERSHSNTESSSIDFKPNSAEVSITTLTGR